MLTCNFRFAAPVAFSFAIALGACKGNADNATLATDTALGRDLAMANRDTAAQPQLRDVPTTPAATPAPAVTMPKRTTTPPTPRPATRPTPRPTTTTTPTTPPAPTTTASGNTVTSGTRGSEGAVARIGAGTAISLTSNDRVCTNTNKAGDRFTATVAEAVQGSNGAVIPAGAKAVIEVTSVKRSENANDKISMAFAVRSVTFNGKTYPLDAEITSAQVDQVRSSTTGNDAKKVIGGAVAGAILGQILGHSTKATVIGAAGGAAAGTAVAMGTGNMEGCVPVGGKIAIKLNSPATIQTN